ncbi:MAG: HAD family hydrolase, partial [Pseudonocardia sp.]
MTLADVVAGATALLLDFDGPVCSVFAGYPSRQISHEMRSLLVDRGVRVSTETDDPHALYVWAATRHGELAGWLDDELTRREIVAVQTATETLGAREVIESAGAADLPVAVASNNAEAAIRRYLDVVGLGRQVALVVGRPYADPDRMKPHPAIIDAALAALGVERDNALFVGDSMTDMEAARRAGVQGIG